MERIKSLPFNFFLVTFGIIAACFFIISVFSTQHLKGDSLVSFALTFDLTVSVTFAYYFFIVRKYKISAFTLLPVYIVSLALASYIIPPERQIYLGYFKELLVIPELALTGFLFVKIRVIVREFKSAKFITKDFIEQLFIGLQKVFKNKIASGVFTTEFSILYYALAFWKRKKEIFENQINVSSHKKTSYSALWFVLTCGVIIETFCLHIFIGKYSNAAAWILTAIGVYSLLFITADFSAIVKRPIVITNDFLYLRCGLRWRVVIPFEKITELKQVKNFKDDLKEYVNISPAKQPNAILMLKEPVEIKGLYWIIKKTDKIAFCVDDFKKLQSYIITHT